jgi:hypothetical protein
LNHEKRNGYELQRRREHRGERFSLSLLRVLCASVLFLSRLCPRMWAEPPRPARPRTGVFFVLEEPLVLVIAVLHLHRHPDAWRDRL